MKIYALLLRKKYIEDMEDNTEIKQEHKIALGYPRRWKKSKLLRIGIFII